LCIGPPPFLLPVAALTSIVGGSTAPLPLSAAEAAQAEQDLSGFDSSSTAAAAAAAAAAASAAAYGQQQDAGGGAASSSSSSGIRAVYLPGGAAAAAAAATPGLRAKRRPPMLRLPAALRGGAAASEKAARQAQQAQQQQAQQAGFQFAGAANQGSEAATAAAEAGAGAEDEAEAATPTLFVATGRLPGQGKRGQQFAGQQANVSSQQVSAQQGQASASKGQQSLALQQQYMGQQGNQHASPAKGLAPECWSPINLQEVRCGCGCVGVGGDCIIDICTYWAVVLLMASCTATLPRINKYMQTLTDLRPVQSSQPAPNTKASPPHTQHSTSRTVPPHLFPPLYRLYRRQWTGCTTARRRPLPGLLCWALCGACLAGVSRWNGIDVGIGWLRGGRETGVKGTISISMCQCYIHMHIRLVPSAFPGISGCGWGVQW
jgi:hypothetical protein